MKECRLASGVFLRYREGEPDRPMLGFVHGFGASGASFLEAFDAPHLRPCALYVPDLPGFGDSPPLAHPRGIQDGVELLLELVAERAPSAGVVLVGHSAGGLVVTRAAAAMPGLRGIVSVEGNLTEADNFISGKVAGADDVEAWRRAFLEDIREPAERDEAFRRYRRDVSRAVAATLRAWALDIVADTGAAAGGDRFRALPVPKLYVYGGRSIAPASLAYLERHDVPRLGFPGAGHSPMIDEPARFYAALADFVAHCTA